MYTSNISTKFHVFNFDKKIKTKIENFKEGEKKLDN